LQQTNQAIRQIIRIARTIELNRELLFVRHLPEIFEICADHRHAVCTRKMRYPAATGRRRIRHYQGRCTLKQVLDLVFLYVSEEVDSRVGRVFTGDRLYVSRRLRMITPGNHQFHIRPPVGNLPECLDHQFQLFVSSPFPESQDAMFRIAAPRKIRILRTVRENAMSPNVYVLAAISFRQYLPVTRHKNRHGVRQQ